MEWCVHLLFLYCVVMDASNSVDLGQVLGNAESMEKCMLKLA